METHLERSEAFSDLSYEEAMKRSTEVEGGLLFAPDPPYQSPEPDGEPEYRSPAEILINRELRRARAKYPEKWVGPVKGFVIIGDQFRQFRRASNDLDREEMERYVIRLGAMCQRYLEDIAGTPRSFEE